MWKYEKEYDKLTDKEKVERLEVLCKTYLMYLNIYDEKHKNLFMKDATEYWKHMNKEYSEMGGD